MSERMTRDDVLAAIERERERLLSLVDRLAGEAETRPVIDGGWTAKDVLAHCVIWVQSLAYGIGAPIQLPRWANEERLPTDQLNARVVAEYRDVPLERVRADLESAVALVVERLRTKSDDEMNAPGVPWAKGAPLWQSVAGETFEHWPEHSADLERTLQWST